MLKNYCKKFSKISSYLIFYMFKNSQYIYSLICKINRWKNSVWLSELHRAQSNSIPIIQVIKTQFLEITNALFSKLVSNMWIHWCELLYKLALIQSHKYVGCSFHKQNLKTQDTKNSWCYFWLIWSLHKDLCSLCKSNRRCSLNAKLWNLGLWIEFVTSIIATNFWSWYQDTKYCNFNIFFKNHLWRKNLNN